MYYVRTQFPKEGVILGRYVSTYYKLQVTRTSVYVNWSGSLAGDLVMRPFVELL